jgi:hypothetical protein
MTNALDLARARLSGLPPAISGQSGHRATFRAACECVRFGLGDGDALALLGEFNRRCSPPWSQKELAHKLADARKAAGGQVRAFARPSPTVRVVWKAMPRRPAVAIVEPAAPAAPPPVAIPELPTPPAPSISLDDAFPDADAPHLAGWLRDGTPIYHGTQGEWIKRIRCACKAHQTRKPAILGRLAAPASRPMQGPDKELPQPIL